MARRLPGRVAGALTVALSLAVPACGDGGDGGDGSDGGQAAPATTTSPLNLSARVQTFPVTSRNHLQGRINYPQTPPVGGDHAGVWMNCGVYAAPVVPEAAVHSLEHGAVWITYRPNLAPADVDKLRRLAAGKRYVLLSPWTDAGLPAPVVASAWGLQLQATSADDPGIAAFVARYAGGSQAPEPGAPCTGGFGTPQQ